MGLALLLTLSYCSIFQRYERYMRPLVAFAKANGWETYIHLIPIEKRGLVCSNKLFFGIHIEW